VGIRQPLGKNPRLRHRSPPRRRGGTAQTGERRLPSHAPGSAGSSAVLASRYDPRMADLNRMAHRIVQKATEPQESESAAEINGRNGGLKGGTARANKLSPEQRSEIARRAARARWAMGKPAR
jgi:hypothetical protein